jgi:hypothetical protein
MCCCAAAGVAGPQGAQGPQGDTGDDGEQGETGQGVKSPWEHLQLGFLLPSGFSWGVGRDSDLSDSDPQVVVIHKQVVVKGWGLVQCPDVVAGCCHA